MHSPLLSIHFFNHPSLLQRHSSFIWCSFPTGHPSCWWPPFNVTPFTSDSTILFINRSFSILSMCPYQLSSLCFAQPTNSRITSSLFHLLISHSVIICYSTRILSDDNLRCLDISSNTFTLDFCNIRGLTSNFQSVEHHLSSTKPHLLFLTETVVCDYW